MEECRVDDIAERKACPRCCNSKEPCLQCHDRLEGWKQAALAFFPGSVLKCRMCMGAGVIPKAWSMEQSWRGFVLAAPPDSRLRLGDVVSVDVEDYSEYFGQEPYWLWNPAATWGVHPEIMVPIGTRDEQEWAVPMSTFAAIVFIHVGDVQDVKAPRPDPRPWLASPAEEMFGVARLGAVRGMVLTQPRRVIEIFGESGLIAGTGVFSRCDAEMVVSSGVEGVERGHRVLAQNGVARKFEHMGASYSRLEPHDILAKGAVA